jgi:hypothetical protein
MLAVFIAGLFHGQMLNRLALKTAGMPGGWQFARKNRQQFSLGSLWPLKPLDGSPDEMGKGA